MGALSEMEIDMKNGEVAPFTLGSNEPETTEFSDEEKQQTEAENAEATLAMLTKEIEKVELPPAQKKKEHEEKEAIRKAEWDKAQETRLEEELFAWENAVCVSDDELAKASTSRIGTDSERLTRRNMKVCVTEHIQTKCFEDMNLARQVLYPRKNMINCFRYINRKAKEFIEQDMKDNDEKPVDGIHGSDVPDDLCYKWAEDYFLDMEADEDKSKEEKFVAKPYTGAAVPKPKKPAKKVEKKVEPKKEEVAETAQTSLMEQASLLTQTTMVEEQSA